VHFSIFFFGIELGINMKISMTLDSIISGFVNWVKEQFENLFSGSGVPGMKKSNHDMKLKWTEDGFGDCYNDGGANLGGTVQVVDNINFRVGTWKRL
jgi:hypothetical protein